MDRRTLTVDLTILRPAADQALVVHGLELVGVLMENFKVADAEMTGTGFEEAGRGERPEHGVPAGAPAGDGHPVAVGEPAVDQVARRIDAVVNVDHAPLPVQPLAVFTAEAGAAAVIDRSEERRVGK